jgi:hypothetical protein
MEIKGHNNTVWWICYNEGYTTIHHGKTEVGGVTTSGQPLHEIFDTEEEYLDRLNELNIKKLRNFKIIRSRR